MTNELNISQLSSSTQKKIKVRPALIADDDDEDGTGDIGIEVIRAVPSKDDKSRSSSVDIDEMGCREHLKTKQQIEELRKEYGDGWLHSHGASKVQDVMGIQPPPKSSASTKQTTEQKLESLFGLQSSSTTRDRTSTPIKQFNHADFGHSPDVRVLSYQI